jgi:enoyl-CoA hydratase/carnithine racemase
MVDSAPATTVASDEVLYEASEHIATLTLNRPDRMNTISVPMLNQLTELLLTADRDPDVRCIILTGTGRAFCAGLDVRASTGGSIG